MEVFDTDKFIGTIQNCPELWKLCAKEYDDKNTRETAWRMVLTRQNQNVTEAEEAAPINSAAGTSRKRKAARTDSESDLAAVLAESLKRKQELDLLMTTDPDRLFLLSLLEDFKQIPKEG
jgi:hypothetical protein